MRREGYTEGHGKGNNPDDVVAAVRKALEKAGGIESFLFVVLGENGTGVCMSGPVIKRMALTAVLNAEIYKQHLDDHIHSPINFREGDLPVGGKLQ